MPIRNYVRSTEAAKSAVGEIVRRVKTGAAEPIVSFDVETRPIPGLEQYPGTLFNDQDERIKPTKKMYLEYAQARWTDSFSLGQLTGLDIRVPRRLTSGSERPGVPAKVAWQEFWAAVQRASDADLEKCRWTSKEAVLGYKVAVEEAVAEHTAQIAVLTGVKGKKKAVEALKVELEHLQWKLTRIPAMLERAAQPLDVRLLRHIVAVGVENRVKVDPVSPGLDPYSSELFSLQVTLRSAADGELETWVFNTALVPPTELRPIFKIGRSVLYLAQNAKFDIKHLMHKLGLDAAPRNIFCTRIGSRMLYLGLKKMPHSLKALASRFCGVEVSKDVRNTFIGVRREELTQEQIDYGAQDTELLFPIYDRQLEIAAERDQVELLREFGKLSWIAGKWELDGYLLDADRWNAISAEATKSRDELARQLEDILLPAGYRETFGELAATDEELETLEELALGSADDEDAPAVDVRRDAVIRISQTALVGERLREVLGERVTAVAFPDGKVSLGKIARGAWERAYRDAHRGETHEFFSLYERWAKAAKQVSTYGDKFLWNAHPLTGAVHPGINIAGTDTARFSGTRPNPFNIPTAKEEGDPDYRSAFLARPGQLWLGADYDAMELRIAFNVTRDTVGKKMVESGKDGHTFTAAQAFHIRKAKISAGARAVRDRFKYGTTTLDIGVYEVPENWSVEQISDFALTDEAVAAVKAAVSGKSSATRTVAKAITFLYLFGGTAYTLAMRTGLPVEQCEDFFERFEAVYPEMSAGMNAIREQVLKNTVEGNDGRIYAWSGAYGGLRRWFILPDNPSRRDYGAGWAGDCTFNDAQKVYRRRIRSIQREAGNVPCQGGNAVITAKALNALVENGHPMGAYPVIAIYDEVLMTFPDTAKPETIKGLLEGCMLDAAAEYMDFVPAGAEADLKKVSRCWVKS